MNKQEFCKKYDLTEDQFLGKEKITGSLHLRSLTSIPEGFNPTVGGSLDLRSLTSIPEGFNPTVGGYLDLRSLTSIPEGFNPTVGGSLDLGSITSIPDGFNPTVGGSLYLGRLTSIPEGFNPTVGGYLDLGSITSIPEGFNPTVGGSLYLGSITSIPDGFNPTVGGSLYLGRGLKSNCRQQSGPIFWEKYVLADGMFTKILSKKGNIYRVKKIEDPKEFYLIVDGVTSAHGDTIKKAKEDLDYKVKSESLKNNPVLADEIITIQRYRAITGACEAGVKAWMQQNNASEMPAKDLLPILEKTNAYGYQKFLKLINF